MDGHIDIHQIYIMYIVILIRNSNVCIKDMESESMVYQVLRRQSGAQPEIRSHDEQKFENGHVESTFREWVDGKQVRYLGEYDLPDDLHATGHYVILSWSKERTNVTLITYRKYPSGVYERLGSGFGREDRYQGGGKCHLNSCLLTSGSGRTIET